MRFLAGCHDCGLLFSNPLPTADELTAFYSGGRPYASSRQRGFVSEAKRRRRLARGRRVEDSDEPRPVRKRDVLFDAIAAHVPVHAPPPGSSVLDFGCGNGKLLDWLQERGWETYGVEPSMDVAFFRHRHLTSLDQDRRFRFVILNHVLEHITNPLGLLRQIARTLRDDGALFVSVPRVDTLPEHGDFRYCISGRTHPVCFSETCLRGLLARASLAVAAPLDAPELDDAFTQGKPLRLRLLVVRTEHPPALPDEPLAPAIRALDLYYREHHGPLERVRRWLPVRLRAALMYRARVRRTARG
jgi:SAM-dependent methyltransferase